MKAVRTSGLSTSICAAPILDVKTMTVSENRTVSPLPGKIDGARHAAAVIRDPESPAVHGSAPLGQDQRDLARPQLGGPRHEAPGKPRGRSEALS